MVYFKQLFYVNFNLEIMLTLLYEFSLQWWVDK